MEKKASPFELPTDRLATTDASGKRVYLYPADVRGRYRARRTILSAMLLLVFLVLPWIRINGHPAILLDIIHRKFALFGIGFWAHEAPLLVLVAGVAIMSLGLVTAVWGRVWCGWACPQTVFVDALFRRIEAWIEGDALSRRKLDTGRADGAWFTKKGVKWALFALLSLLISHSFLAYFVGTEALKEMIQSSPSTHPLAFLSMAVMFAGVLFDFGWFREQFCVVVCPYGRFQSVLMDARSQAVLYDASRGEPRKGLEPAPSTGVGDCVNCYRCVQVCPTGVDIRRGVQLECIACTACIDACDEVMTRLKRPKGLIRYESTAALESRERASAWAKPRPWINASLLALLIGGLTTVLATRKSIALTILRASEAPYQLAGDGRVVNHFKLDVRNQTFADQAITFSLPSGGATLVVSNHQRLLPAGEAERADLFIEYPKSLLAMGKGAISVEMRAVSTTTQKVEASLQEVRLVGPYR